MLKERKSNLNDNLLNTLKEFSDGINVNSVIGTPIKVLDYYIIPISKLTVGYLGGGGEYGDVKVFSQNKSHPFACGNGTVLNMNPNGFLVCKNSGVTFIKIEDTLTEKIFDKTTEIINETLK